MFILEAINHLVEKLNRSSQSISLISSITETINTFGCTIFGQYLSGRSILRTVQIIGIMLFTMTLSASFSTSTIVGNDEVKINTLRDVITQNKKPLWIEGESMAELFQHGVTTDYRDVHELAKRKGTVAPIPISSLGLFDNMEPDLAYFCSNEIARAVNKISIALGKTIAQHEYKSPKPYHRALAAFLLSPSHDKKEITKRIAEL